LEENQMMPNHCSKGNSWQLKARHKKAREMVQQAFGVMELVADCRISDCSEQDPTKCEVYLVEGDSAGEQQNKVSDRNFQTICYRSKILNVEKAITT
jgi:DNA gyrase subunit B